MPADYVLTYAVTAGNVDPNADLVIDAARRMATYVRPRDGGARRTSELTSEELAQVTEALEKAPYIAFAGPINPKGPVFRNGRSYAITVRAAGRDHSVSFGDGDAVPPAVTAAQAVIAELILTRFPPSGVVSGAPSR